MEFVAVRERARLESSAGTGKSAEQNGKRQQKLAREESSKQAGWIAKGGKAHVCQLWWLFPFPD